MTQAPRILLHNDQTAHLAVRLRDANPDVVIAECNTYADLPDAIRSFAPDIVYTVRFDGTPDFPRDALFGGTSPKWIANGGVGTDHFGIWNPDQKTVTNAAGVAADMMAEYCLGGFLRFTLDHPGLEADQKAGVWRARQVAPLNGKVLLIVGLGQTGRALAKRAQAFGMRVIGIRARPQVTDHVEQVFAPNELNQALAMADAIAVATPLTDQTRHMFGPEQFAAMKHGILFADVSRGGVVDQSALAKALHSGTIGGAVLDVFETEPLPTDSPLWDAPNTLISPHCSSVYDGWENASFSLFLANLHRWIVGERLASVVDPRRGY